MLLDKAPVTRLTFGAGLFIGYQRALERGLPLPEMAVTGDGETVATELDTALRRRVIESIGMVLPRLLEREIPDVTEGMLLVQELGLRSTAILELLVELEESLEIQIDVEDIDRDDMNSVGDLASFVASHSLADG
jgi:acyl carrier protein